MRLKINNPKTTLAGLVGAAGTLCSALYPEYKIQVAAAAAFGVALIGVFAQDAPSGGK